MGYEDVRSVACQGSFHSNIEARTDVGVNSKERAISYHRGTHSLIDRMALTYLAARTSLDNINPLRFS